MSPSHRFLPCSSTAAKISMWWLLPGANVARLFRGTTRSCHRSYGCGPLDEYSGRRRVLIGVVRASAKTFLGRRRLLQLGLDALADRVVDDVFDLVGRHNALATAFGRGGIRPLCRSPRRRGACCSSFPRAAPRDATVDAVGNVDGVDAARTSSRNVRPRFSYVDGCKKAGAPVRAARSAERLSISRSADRSWRWQRHRRHGGGGRRGSSSSSPSARIAFSSPFVAKIGRHPAALTWIAAAGPRRSHRRRAARVLGGQPRHVAGVLEHCRAAKSSSGILLLEFSQLGVGRWAAKTSPAQDLRPLRPFANRPP